MVYVFFCSVLLYLAHLLCFTCKSSKIKLKLSASKNPECYSCEDQTVKYCKLTLL